MAAHNRAVIKYPCLTLVGTMQVYLGFDAGHAQEHPGTDTPLRWFVRRPQDADLECMTLMNELIHICLTSSPPVPSSLALSLSRLLQLHTSNQWRHSRAPLQNRLCLNLNHIRLTLARLSEPIDKPRPQPLTPLAPSSSPPPSTPNVLFSTPIRHG